MRDALPALTLHAPWAYAVAHLGKRIENRTWAPPARLVGQRLAIHAGLHETQAEWAAVSSAARMTRDDLDCARHDVARGAVVATATLSGFTQEPVRDALGWTSLWWIGPVGWLLADVVTLPEPVPCKGRQGLWSLPAPIHDAVMREIARAG
jgi:hypothetical protein